MESTKERKKILKKLFSYICSFNERFKRKSNIKKKLLKNVYIFKLFNFYIDELQ